MPFSTTRVRPSLPHWTCKERSTIRPLAAARLFACAAGCIEASSNTVMVITLAVPSIARRESCVTDEANAPTAISSRPLPPLARALM